MAPKRPRLGKTEAQSEKPAKIPKSTPVSDKTSPASGTTVMPAQDGKIALLENGLLDISKTPMRLREIMQRNAVESPLLRLPGEIRNKIWVFASSGSNVEICSRLKSPGTVEFYNNTPQQLDHGPGTQPAFHLPQVCRQVYDETATMAYALAHFVFLFKSNYWQNCIDDLKQWATERCPAHVNAITRIGVTSHIMDASDYTGGFPRRTGKFSLRNNFPCLSHVYLQRNHHAKAMPEGWQVSWRRRIEREMASLEGSDLKILWTTDF